MRTLAFVAGLLFALVGIAAPVPKGIKKTPPSLDGDWRMESMEVNGKMNPPTPREYNIWKVKGEAMQLVREGDTTKEGVYPCRLVSNQPAEGLATFEYTVQQNSYNRRGVCELDGDTLRVAFEFDASKPPTDLKSGPKATVYTFKRLGEGK